MSYKTTKNREEKKELSHIYHIITIISFQNDIYQRYNVLIPNLILFQQQNIYQHPQKRIYLSIAMNQLEKKRHSFDRIVSIHCCIR